MWNKSAKFLMVQVKMQNHRGFAIPVPFWVVDELFEAIKDIAWLGEMILEFIPLPQEESARKHIRFVKTISLSGLISVSHNIINDLKRHKGLNIIDVETGDVQVKVHLK